MSRILPQTAAVKPSVPTANPFNTDTVMPLLSSDIHTDLQKRMPDTIQKLVHNFQIQPYQQTRSLTEGEQNAVKQALTRWWDNIIVSDGMPIIGKLASPIKKAAVSTGLNGAASLGVLETINAALNNTASGNLAVSLKVAGQEMVNNFDTISQFHPHWDIALPLAGLGGLISGVGTWIKQKQQNQNVLDFLRLTAIENPSVRVMNSDFSHVINRVFNKSWFNLNLLK